MKRLLLVVICVLTLTSCIGIESRISLKDDGSGTLQLAYRVSRFMKDLDTAEETRALPLPVTREDFQRTVDAAKGLRLASLRQWEDEQDVHIEARLDFDRTEALNAIGREDQTGLSFSAADGKHIFRQQVYRGRNFEEISPETLQMLETFFDGYALSYLITAPAPILKYSGGELSADKRSLSYKTTIPQLLKSGDRVTLEVVW